MESLNNICQFLVFWNFSGRYCLQYLPGILFHKILVKKNFFFDKVKKFTKVNGAKLIQNNRKL